MCGVQLYGPLMVAPLGRGTGISLLAIEAPLYPPSSSAGGRGFPLSRE